MDETYTLSEYIREAVDFMRLAESAETDIFADAYDAYAQAVKAALERYVHTGKQEAICRRYWLLGQTYSDIAIDYGYASTQTVRSYIYQTYKELDEIQLTRDEFMDLGGEAYVDR